MTTSQSVSVILNSMLSRVTPALLISTVGPPSSAATRVDGGLDLLGVADVGADGQRLATGGLDRLDGGLGGGLVEVEDGDGEPVLRQPEGRRCTDAAGGTGDDGHAGCVVASLMEVPFIVVLRQPSRATGQELRPTRYGRVASGPVTRSGQGQIDATMIAATASCTAALTRLAGWKAGSIR